MTREELAKTMLENLAYGNANAEDIWKERAENHAHVRPNPHYLSGEERARYATMSPEEREAFNRARSG